MSRLLAWKFRLAWRSLAHRPRVAVVVSLVLALLALALSGAVFMGARWLFGWVLKGLPEMAPEVAAALAGMESHLLSLVYLVGLTLCFFTAFWKAFVTMYSSSDLPLLFAAPLTVRQVFTIKFVEVLASESLWTFLLVLPATLGYGVAVGAAWWYYPAALMLALTTVFLPAAAGTSLNLLAIRFIPPHRVKELMAALGLLLGAAFYALIQLGPGYIADMSPEGLVQLADRFRLVSARYSPARWLGEAAYTAGRGLATAFLSWFGLTAVCSLVFFALSFLLVEKAFYSGWAGSAEVHRRPRVARQLVKAQRVRPPLLALAAKEIRSIARDIREWAQVLYLMVVASIGIVVPMVRGRTINFPGDPSGLYIALVLAYMLLEWLANHLGLGAVGREGKTWFLLRSAPVSAKEIIWGKVLGIVPLVTVPALVLAPGLGWALGGGLQVALVTAAFVLLVGPGLTSLNVAAGAVYPNFTARDPRQRISLLGLLLSWLLAIGYAGVLALGTWLVVTGAWVGSQVAGLTVLVAGSVCAVVIPAILAGRVLDAREAIFAAPKES